MITCAFVLLPARIKTEGCRVHRGDRYKNWGCPCRHPHNLKKANKVRTNVSLQSTNTNEPQTIVLSHVL